MDSLYAVVLFAISASVTPGPNNIMVMSAGASVGTRSQPEPGVQQQEEPHHGEGRAHQPGRPATDLRVGEHLPPRRVPGQVGRGQRPESDERGADKTKTDVLDSPSLRHTAQLGRQHGKHAPAYALG